jgi:hypothetical protein
MAEIRLQATKAYLEANEPESISENIYPERLIVLRQYAFDDDGRITTMGQFEGERIFAPHFFEKYTRNHDMDGQNVFTITDYEREAFPELGQFKYAAVFHREERCEDTYTEVLLMND